MADAFCIAAGFFVTKTVARDARRSPDLLPPTLVSLSPCIAPSYQVHWGWEVEKSREAAVAFGLPESRLSELHPWERRHGISHPNVFHSLEDARDFVAEFLPARDDCIIVGAALPAVLVDGLLEEPHARSSTAEPWGVPMMVAGRRPLPEGGERLGFDVVLFGYNVECSWLCTGAERAVAAALGITPNAHGLVETYDDALRVHAWFEAHPDEGEPGAYYPWLVVRYPLG